MSEVARHVFKDKSRDRSNLECEESLYSFNVAASFKISDHRVIILKCHQASHWRMPVALTALHGTTESIGALLPRQHLLAGNNCMIGRHI